jgi:hypothetical protein
LFELFFGHFAAGDCRDRLVHVLVVKPVNPVVDVMITIFCDFCQLSAKNLAFFP